MECEANADVVACAGNINNNIQGATNENDQSSKLDSSCFLRASDLYLIRGNVCKNKCKDEDLELYKGSKIYYPSENPFSEEIVEGIMDDQKKSLELQRAVKSRDCIKAKWNEELKVAIVPYLKGKPTQHMGVNLKGNCALSPQEALFLLEKGLIEIEYNNMPLSVEEAYTVMLKGKLSIEKYEVFSFLSQQGFIVVHHQSRIGPSYEQRINLEKKKQRKRKATDGVNDSPEQKRLTFSGVLASNSELNSVNAESSILSNDSALNTSNLQKVQSVSHDILSSAQNIADSLQGSDKLNSEALITISPDSTNRMESNDSTEKNASTVPLGQANEDNNMKTVGNDINSSKRNENSNKVPGYDTLNNKEDQNGKELEEMMIENIDEGKEIDIENSNDDDTNEVIIEDEQKLDKNDDLNVDESLSDYYENDNFVQTDDSIPEMCEEAEKSLDVYSCSPGDHQSVLEDLNSETDNVHSGPSKELDDDITLVEVKKKEKKPLAVIDLLSDDDDDDDDDEEDDDDVSCAEQQKKGKKLSLTDVSTDDEQTDKTNGTEMYEDSDDEIQVLKVYPVQINNAHASSRNANCVKSESKKLRISKNSANIKSSFRPRMKFPDLCKKDIMCLPRPPPDLLPNHVQPAKEVYVINYKLSVPNQGRVWNSFKDMQDYQRERRRERHSNSRPGGSVRDYRSQNDLFYNQISQFNSPENSRDFGFDRNSQNFMVHSNRNLNPQASMNNDRSVALLPTPNVFNPPSHMPFMNIHNLQNLSSSNPVAFVNEIQKTVYSVASTMISSMFGQRLNPNNPSSRSSPTFSEPLMGFNSHPHFNNFAQNPSPFQTPGIPGPMVMNPAVRNDFHPMRFPPNPFSGDQYPMSVNNPFMPESNWRPLQNLQSRKFSPHKGPLFPCTYRNVSRKKNWSDVKAAVVGTSTSDSGSDIEEVPINLNQILWSNDIQPLIKPGSKLAVSEVLKSLQITQKANLCDTKCFIDRYMPTTPSLEISFDVYLPNSNYRRSAPSVPNYRIIVLRVADPIPRYSELVGLKRKWNDEAALQIAVVDHGDISFYSFNNFNVPEIIPFES